jgi:hypothetical protein
MSLPACFLLQRRERARCWLDRNKDTGTIRRLLDTQHHANYSKASNATADPTAVRATSPKSSLPPSPDQRDVAKGYPLTRLVVQLPSEQGYLLLDRVHSKNDVVELLEER